MKGGSGGSVREIGVNDIGVMDIGVMEIGVKVIDGKDRGVMEIGVNVGDGSVGAAPWAADPNSVQSKSWQQPWTPSRITQKRSASQYTPFSQHSPSSGAHCSPPQHSDYHFGVSNACLRGCSELENASKE